MHYLNANWRSAKTEHRSSACSAHGRFGLKLYVIVIAVARPVTMQKSLLHSRSLSLSLRHFYKRFCASPTGDNGRNLFCTRVLFHIAANFYRRTANGRPYGLLFFAKRSFGQWQFPKTSAENNRAVAILKCTILMRIGRLPRPNIARPPAAAGKQFGLRAEVIVHFHCLNDRVVKNSPPVGASIARPLLTQNKFGSALKRESIYRLSH